MKHVLVFIILALPTSWQQDSTETINETLDRLIQQTDLVEHKEKNSTDFYIKKNNSRIFFLNPPERDQKTEEDKSQVTSIKTDADNHLSIADLLHALGMKSSKSLDDVGKSNIINEITLTVEKNTKPITTNTDHGEIKLLIERLMSKSGSLADIEDIPENNLLTFTSGTENNLLHKYPEIIIDRITYHNDENKNKKETKVLIEEQDSQAAKNQNSYPLALAEELKSLLKDVQNMKVTETANENALQKTDHTHNKPNIQENQIGTQQPCQTTNILMPYSSTCKSMLLNKLSEYQNLHDTITGWAGNPHLDTSLQLNKWRAYNARQNALMRVTRAQKLKRIHFFTDLITNMMSRFVYRPLYS